MRDYSFGNFISALRERRGLSQYQLGALVGVSDKAVSKWENGVSKPRIGMIRKLSEVLDISVDELLTCEYATFNELRKDLFTMKKEIIRIANNKMQELYGENPPIIIANRFHTEELMLDSQDTLLWMGFLGKLQAVCDENNAYFEARGAQMGASFIAWLLGATTVNPLSAHYYCPACKKVEFISDEKYGVDAEDKICLCGNAYIKDGFDIDAINMYPFTNHNEVYVSGNMTKVVKQCLDEYFVGMGKVRKLEIADAHIEMPESYKVTKYALLSNEVARKYSEDVIAMSTEVFYSFSNEFPVLNIIENTDETLSSKSPLTISSDQIQRYVEYGLQNEKFKNYDSAFDMSNVVQQKEKIKFGDLLAISGFIHSTGAWKNNAEILYEKGHPLTELIYCREDVYSFLHNKIQLKYGADLSGIAYDIKEQVRKGIYSHKAMPEDIEKLLYESEVPRWYIESMKKIRYLFPKTQLIAALKCEIYNIK